MDWLPDRVIAHLKDVIDAPDLSGTKYELIEEIGRGGMGSVYLAHDMELGRNVALKVLNGSAPAQEARTLAALEHPGIVPVHDAGVLPDGRAFYAMKFVHGVRLDRYSASNPALTDLLRVFIRVCEPVAFAHANGLIHRDLKPENIMVGSFGEVLVLDWGISERLLAPNVPIAGSSGYMSPEQAAGDPQSCDVRSDIYALGRILEFLLRDLQAPKPVRAIAAKASHPDRNSRYAGVLELTGDIARFLDGEPVTAYRESMLERASRWLAHHKTLTALLATYILVRAVIFLFAGR